MIEECKICFQCLFANYDKDLGFYEIRCDFDNKIHDENGSCENFKYNPNYPKVNPRLNNLDRFIIGFKS